MRKQMLILSSLLLAMILMVGVMSCKKSSELDHHFQPVKPESWHD